MKSKSAGKGKNAAAQRQRHAGARVRGSAESAQLCPAVSIGGHWWLLSLSRRPLNFCDRRGEWEVMEVMIRKRSAGLEKCTRARSAVGVAVADRRIIGGWTIEFFCFHVQVCSHMVAIP